MTNSSKANVSFSIEQWELIRRLRNSGLSKEHICHAYDDLDRIEREFGSLYNSNNDVPSTNVNNGLIQTTLHQQHQQQPQKHHHQQQQQNGLHADQLVISKNFQILMAKNLAAINYQRFLNNTSTPNTNTNTTSPSAATSPTCQTTTLSLTTPTNTTTTTTTPPSGVLPHLPLLNCTNHRTSTLSPISDTTSQSLNVNTNVVDDDTRELEEFRMKGDSAIHSDISHFVYRYDLKQSQIARMAGVNQAYVSKFLRGEFNDLSENGKTLIFRWYLKYFKNPLLLQTFKQNGHNDYGCGEPLNKIIKLEHNNNSYSYVNMQTAPKRTRFSFKLEHLAILEKSFVDCPYPDPKKREELARLCNSIRNGELTEREKVTEQIVTHWFQNKRKLTRKMNSDDINSEHNTNQNEDLMNYEVNGDSTSVEYDIDSPDHYHDEEVQLAAYKAIMSRMNSSPIARQEYSVDYSDKSNSDS